MTGMPALFEHAQVIPIGNGGRMLLKELPPKPPRQPPALGVQVNAFWPRPRVSWEEMEKWYEDVMEIINVFWQVHQRPFGMSEIRHRCALDPVDPDHQWGRPVTGRMQRQGFHVVGMRSIPKEFNPKAKGRLEPLWSLAAVVAP